MPAELHGIRGQAAPAANTDAVLVAAVPAGRKTTLTTIVVTNTSGAPTSYRLNARINGAAVAVGNQIASDVLIAANDSVGITWGVTLGPGDILNCRSGGGVTFTAFGVEEDLV